VTDYASFSLFYDQIMGDRSEEFERVRGQIRTYSPAARSLLELGCGTGAILAGLGGEFAATGLDRSPEMLAVAAARLPSTPLVRADMTSFALHARFDVVICVFDTLNHLPLFSQWLALFDRAYEHLNERGLFIFDVNTTGRLRGLEGPPAYFEEVGGNPLIMTVQPAGDGLWLWETRIFEHQGGNQYRLHHERIHERAEPLGRIRSSLADRFELLEESSLDGSPVSDESDRVFFVYRRRAGIEPQAHPEVPQPG
jgi:SAM-dependent methyltransferase